MTEGSSASSEIDKDYQVYEVFIQYHQLEHHQHVGSLNASDSDMALQLARENFLRREAAVNVWVVPRDAIVATAYTETDYFASEFDKSYRRVDGYSDNARRWKQFRQKSLALEELVRD